MSRFFVGGDSLEVYKEEVILNDNVVRKLKNTCTFASKRFEISNGSIRYIPKTNIAYIEPSRLIVDGKCYLIFGSNEINYISETNIYNKFPIKQLEDKIRRDAIK